MVVHLEPNNTCTMTVTTGGRQDPVSVDVTEEEPMLLFTRDRPATTFDVVFTEHRERLFLKVKDRFVDQRQNSDESFKFLVLASEGTSEPDPPFLSFEQI